MMTLFKMEDSVPFNINRHCGFWTFIICRPCLMPIFWYCTIGHIVSGEFWNIEVGTQAIWIIAGLGLDVLNLIWLKALVIGILISNFYYKNCNLKNITIGYGNPTHNVKIGHYNLHKNVKWDRIYPGFINALLLLSIKVLT